MVAPNILSVTVTVTVTVDVSYASGHDHDPSIGISDGRSFIGIKADDRTSLPCHIEDGDSSADDRTSLPCHIEDGDNSTSILKNVHQIVGPTATSQCYSSEIKIEPKSAEQWGSCHTEHDGGYTNVCR